MQCLKHGNLLTFRYPNSLLGEIQPKMNLNYQKGKVTDKSQRKSLAERMLPNVVQSIQHMKNTLQSLSQSKIKESHFSSNSFNQTSNKFDSGNSARMLNRFNNNLNEFSKTYLKSHKENAEILRDMQRKKLFHLLNFQNNRRNNEKGLTLKQKPLMNNFKNRRSSNNSKEGIGSLKHIKLNFSPFIHKNINNKSSNIIFPKERTNILEQPFSHKNIRRNYPQNHLNKTSTRKITIKHLSPDSFCNYSKLHKLKKSKANSMFTFREIKFKPKFTDPNNKYNTNKIYKTRPTKTIKISFSKPFNNFDKSFEWHDPHSTKNNISRENQNFFKQSLSLDKSISQHKVLNFSKEKEKHNIPECKNKSYIFKSVVIKYPNSNSHIYKKKPYLLNSGKSNIEEGRDHKHSVGKKYLKYNFSSKVKSFDISKFKNLSFFKKPKVLDEEFAFIHALKNKKADSFLQVKFNNNNIEKGTKHEKEPGKVIEPFLIYDMLSDEREEIIKQNFDRLKLSKEIGQSSIINYKVIRSIGKGSFGRVYLGIHKITGKYVAIKTIEKSVLSNDNSLNKIMQEVYILKHMRHSNIIRFV